MQADDYPQRGHQRLQVQRAFRLEAAGGNHQTAGLARPGGECGGQAALADAGFAEHQRGGSRPGSGPRP